ncbi:hypothetical protein [Pseudarthrobacter sp. PS3-L1]|uniref:hypothetical protein n=1 Tax=Pseudarthrobacter sp. PS3-L1 TaxID=3046207 RepID=UPI0024BABF07|nr:hypothetical protein [Pseudarthrobacter sp. PS3-L1]MDJ0321477.1 hypothetical protein [Pseudarthrobacter sp. PS3-L1]
MSATALGTWPGQDAVEATRIIRGELGTPHLPFLPELPARGVGADAIGRSASLLVDMAADVQPHGWRITSRPGRDIHRARSLLKSDINVLADVAGTEDSQSAGIKISLAGPLSLAAELHLHSGERSLLDHGARRDVAHSLAAGVGEHLRQVAAAVPDAAIIVQLDEPEISRILAGTIPTASGYRTLRSLGQQEAIAHLRIVIDALHDAGAAAVVISIPSEEAPIALLRAAGADGLAVPLRGLDRKQWEVLAEAVEAGFHLWAGALEIRDGTPDRTATAVKALWTPWRETGLTAAALGGVRLTPAIGLDTLTPAAATQVLKRLTQAADGVNQLILG